MKKALFFPLQVSLYTVGYLYASGSIIQAQVVPDGTTSTTVNAENGNFTIEQGDRAGNNLFHSFGDFSVPTSGSAFFNNAADISNIFSRVTGGNISNIDGLIGANGSANLFLINPAGIIFGNNARLDIGGSFYGSSASSIVFDDGEFSAVDNLEQPLLTVNAPIGLGFRDSPGEIVNRSFAQNSADEFVGLEVLSGQTLALIGGDIIFEAGEATARGGNIEIGGLSEAGIVSFNIDGSLSFPDDIVRANLLFENAADLDVRGTGGGNITVNANNLQLTDGEFGGSSIRAGITSDSTSADAQAGDILVNATGDITLNNIRILNQVDSDGVGNSGNITINTSFLEVINGGDISASTFGQGNAGLVDIIATENINLDGVDSSGFPSGVTSFVAENAEGNAGGINIETSNLVLTNGSSITSSNLGLGNGGLVSISTDNLSLFDGGQINASVSGQGNAGNINLDITNTTELNTGNIFSQVGSTGVGDGGNIILNTSNLSLLDGSQISAGVFGAGDAGNLTINASGDITVQGVDPFGFPSGILNNVAAGGIGNAGNIIVTTANLSLIDGGSITSDVFGGGNTGSITINASDAINISGTTLFDENTTRFSQVSSQTGTDVLGNAGGIEIDASSLTITDGGFISTSTDGQGNAGNIILNIDGAVNLTNNADIFNDVNSNAITEEGTTSTIAINADSLSIADGESSISASTSGRGNAGNIILDITNTTELNTGNIFSQVNEAGVGDGGNITLTTSDLSLLDGAQISAGVFGNGDAGNITANVSGDITFQGVNPNSGNPSAIFNSVASSGTGDAGNTVVTTANLSLIDGGRITSGVFGEGNAGSIEINASDAVNISGTTVVDENNTRFSRVDSSTGTDVVGNAGSIEINANSLTISDGSVLETSTDGQGNAGNIILDITNTTELNTGNIFSQVNEAGVGDGGNITLNTSDLSLLDGAQISAGVFGIGNGGNITINTSDSILIDGISASGFSSSVTSNVEFDAEGNSGEVNIATDNLFLTNGGQINTSISGQGDGGDINISTSNLDLTNGGSITASTFGEGNAGNIEIMATSIEIFGFNDENSTSGLFANTQTESMGDAGDIFVSTTNLNISNNGTINIDSLGQGDGGNIAIQSESLLLNNNASISSTTTFGLGGNVDIQVANNLTLDNNSNITVGAFEEATGGNINIDAGFIIAFPSSIPNDGNDIIAQAELGSGGSINISTNAILGMAIRPAVSGNGTNDISAASEQTPFDESSQFAAVDLQNTPPVVMSEQTSEQVCKANRQTTTTQSSFTIRGKGGIPNDPSLPLDSQNISINGDTSPTSTIPQPIETSQGEIQPARGIKVTKDGGIILTAYRTNNSGARIPHNSQNCS